MHHELTILTAVVVIIVVIPRQQGGGESLLMCNVKALLARLARDSRDAWTKPGLLPDCCRDIFLAPASETGNMSIPGSSVVQQFDELVKPLVFAVYTDY